MIFAFGLILLLITEAASSASPKVRDGPQTTLIKAPLASEKSTSNKEILMPAWWLL